jgi:hypothetical protein
MLGWRRPESDGRRDWAEAPPPAPLLMVVAKSLSRMRVESPIDEGEGEREFVGPVRGRTCCAKVGWAESGRGGVEDWVGCDVVAGCSEGVGCELAVLGRWGEPSLPGCVDIMRERWRES